MSATRKGTFKKEKKLARQIARIRDGFARAARIMGLEDVLHQMPHRWRQQLWGLPVCQPVIQPTPDSAHHPDTPAITAELQQRLRQATLPLANGATCPLADMLSYVPSLEICLRWMQNDPSPAIQALAEKSRPIARAFTSQYSEDALMGLIGVVRAGCAELGRMDRLHLSSDVSIQNTATGGLRTVASFTVHPAEQVQIDIDGQPRTAFRCGFQGLPGEPFQWSRVSSSELNMLGDKHSIPIYVQQHALHRLEERLWPLRPSLANAWMNCSLHAPRIITRDGNHFGIEYRFLNWRLGYLMARRIDQCLVITTFMFLTMQGTPEARKLQKYLRLHRQDIEYQRLDQFATFQGTDMLEDPELAAIFQKCGCGQFIEMRQQLPKGMCDHADEMRRYLCLDDEFQRQTLRQRMHLKLPAIAQETEDAQAA